MEGRLEKPALCANERRNKREGEEKRV